MKTVAMTPGRKYNQITQLISKNFFYRGGKILEFNSQLEEFLGCEQDHV